MSISGDNNSRTILEAGFEPPPQDTFLKDDPRGVEYGQFTASLIPADRIQVTWTSADFKRNYTMIFTGPGHFAAWAAECT